MQLSFVASSPMGTIVTDPRDNQKYVLVPYQFAQQMFRNSKYLMDFEAEYRVQELLPAEEFVSLDAVSTKADLPHKVFIGVRGEGEDQVSYILQEESLDDEPVYRILYVMEEVDMDELETFNAVVIGRKPKGYAATAVMYQKMLEQAELQETLLHLESAVRLGLITEEEIMQKMIQKFGSEFDDKDFRYNPYHSRSHGKLAYENFYNTISNKGLEKLWFDEFGKVLSLNELERIRSAKDDKYLVNSVFYEVSEAGRIDLRARMIYELKVNDKEKLTKMKVRELITEQDHKSVYSAEDRDESERMTRAEAEALANKVSDMLEPYADFVEVCGSYRRGREDPGDLDVVVILKEGITLPEIVAELEGNYEKYNWLGEKKTQLVIDGVKVDIKVSTPTGIGAALLYFTGPSGYNIGMRSAAKRKGFKLNEYGLFDRDTNEYLGGATEEEIYDLLGRTYKPPEMRAEEGQPVMRPMEFGEPVNWTPFDGTPSLKRRRDAETFEGIPQSVSDLEAVEDVRCDKYELEVNFENEDMVMVSGEELKAIMDDGWDLDSVRSFEDAGMSLLFTRNPKRAFEASGSVSSDADLFWLWLCDEDLVFHRLLARMYRSKNFGFLREPGQRNPETFDFSYYGYNEGHLEYLLDNSLLSLEEQNEEALDNISFQLAQKMMNWVEMASNDIGMPDWTSEEMVVAVDLGNTYAEDMVYLIFPDGSEMQMETFNVVKGYPMYDETYSREIIVPQRKKQIGGVKVPIARIPMDESSDSMQFIWSGELKVVAINDREPYSFKDGQV